MKHPTVRSLPLAALAAGQPALVTEFRRKLASALH